MPTIRLPSLLVAIFSYFSASGVEREITIEDFVHPHVENQMEPVSRTSIEEKYGGVDNQLSDLPQGNMYGPARRSMLIGLSNMWQTGSSLEDLTQSYMRYLSSNLDYLSGAELGDVFGSDRVLYTAQIVEKLVKKGLVDNIRDGLRECSSQMTPSMKAIEQRVLYDEGFQATVELYSGILLLNQYAKLNAVNLTAFLAFLVSDSLTFLGIHNATWIFKQFTNWIIGGGGHLRHKDGIYTVKRNSSGLNYIVEFLDYCLALPTTLLSGITQDAITSLKCHIISRITMAQFENDSSVIRTEDTILCLPSRREFLRMKVMDEFLRSVDLATLNAIIRVMPRDASGGHAVHKTLEPKNNEPLRKNGVAMQIPGMPPFITVIGTNTNDYEESCKTLFVVVHALYPGADEVGHDLMGSDKKRRLNQQSSNTTSGKGTKPRDQKVEATLAWVLGVLPMFVRRCALMNKTGQSTMEINDTSLQMFNWFMNFVHNNLSFFIGATIYSDFSRVMEGYLSRGVGMELITTAALQMRRADTYKLAAMRTIMLMESSALRLHTTHVAILSGLTRILDFNIVAMNQIVAYIIGRTPGWSHTPVLNLDWLCDALDPSKPIDLNNPNAVMLHAYLSRLEIQGNYVAVKELAESKTYAAMECYLEAYLSIKKGSFVVWIQMIREGMKRFDLGTLINSDDVSLARLCSRLNVAHPGSLNPDHEVNSDSLSYLWVRIVPRSHEIRECYVNVVLHLFMMALQGTDQLHPENAPRMAIHLYSFLMRRFVPSQFIPSGIILMESFCSNSTIEPMVCEVDRSRLYSTGKVEDDCRSDYILRRLKDLGAWTNQALSEFPAMIDNYAAEDTVHMGPLVQMHKFFSGGVFPERFMPVPNIRIRAPELKATRIYPVRDLDENGEIGEAGVICISPLGKSFTLLTIGDIQLALPLDLWPIMLEDNNIAVGPLIHRANALVQFKWAGELKLGVIKERNGNPFGRLRFSSLEKWKDQYKTDRYSHSSRYFMDVEGKYMVGDGERDYMIHFDDLVPVQLGTHIYVEIDPLRDAIGDESRAPGDFEFAKGWLRYPDECSKVPSNPLLVYVAFRAGRDVEVYGVPVEACGLEDPGDPVLDRLTQRQ